ncbi:hypothetical protein KQR57_19645 [Bacillus inaquosorum]|nr:hypothetical protein [Bacillus inaquosorum]
MKVTKQGINVDYGTYKLIIRSNQDNQLFGISTSFIYSANRIYFNGQSIGQSGDPSNKPDFTAQNRPYTSFLRFTRVTMNLWYNFQTSEKRRDGESQSQLLLAPRSK